jgi:putative membrane protein
MAASENRRSRPSAIVRLGISWLTNALVLAVVVIVLRKVHVSDVGTLLLAAAVFGVLNTILKPLLMLVVTKVIVSGFVIHGFWTEVEATLIVWLVNLALDFTPGPWQITGSRRQLRRGR